VVGGVAGGVARTLGIDPILIRVAFVVLTIFGGSGILLYLAGWLFIPEDGHEVSTGERFFRDSNALAIVAVALIAVLVVGPALAWGWWGGGPQFGGVLLLVLVVIGIVALVRHSDRAAAETSNPTSRPIGQPTGHPTLPLPAAPVTAYPSAPPPPPAPPREKSVLGRLTVGAALLVSGILIALDLGNVMDVRPVTVIASALGVVAVGLLIGTMLGRSRGLIFLGVALVLVLVPVAAIPDGLHMRDGVGDRNYRPTTWSDVQPDYELGVGSMTIDLRRVDVVGQQSIDVSVGVGEVIVLLPPDVPVDVSAEVGAGVIDFPRTPQQGGMSVDKTWSRDGDSTGSLNLHLDTGLGSISVMEKPLISAPVKQTHPTPQETQ